MSTVQGASIRVIVTIVIQQNYPWSGKSHGKENGGILNGKWGNIGAYVKVICGLYGENRKTTITKI